MREQSQGPMDRIQKWDDILGFIKGWKTRDSKEGDALMNRPV